MKSPKISIAIPVHNMKNRDFFLNRCLDSIRSQTFQDFEIVITEKGKMAENTNAAIKESNGELIKILFMDDYLAHKDSLKEIVDNFKSGWLVTGCKHDDGKSIGSPHLPVWNDYMHKANNTIGSPSILTIENDNPLLFDESMSWTLDCDYYIRLYNRYGLPTFLNTYNVNIGVGDHQMSALLTNAQKMAEQSKMYKRYAKFN